MTYPSDVDPRYRVWDRPSDRLHAAAERDYSALRGATGLSDQARRAKIAQRWTKLQADMAVEQQNAGTNTLAVEAAARRRLHGIDDLTSGATPAEQAAMHVSFRDAQARVAGVTDPREAQQLLDNATATGDELMVRAVGSHAIHTANSVLGSAFGDVAAKYLEARPAKAAAHADLDALRVSPTDVAALFQYVVPKPSELSGLSDAQAHDLAREADSYTTV